MNKLEFNNLKVLEQLDYVNKLLEQGNSLRGIARSLNMSKATYQVRFEKAGYTFNEKLQKYCKSNNNYLSITKELQKNRKCDVQAVEPSITKVLPKYNKYISEDDTQDIKDLLNVKDELLQMLKNYKSNINTTAKNKLDINNLPIELQTNIVNQSLKVYEPIAMLFNEICTEYSQYKKQDLFSIALLDFCNKYKK